MGFGSHYVSSPSERFSTEDYNEWIDKHYHNSDDDNEKTFPDWFCLHLFGCLQRIQRVYRQRVFIEIRK